MILGGDIDSLIDFFSFTVWIFYGMSMAAVIILRKTSPNLARPYKVPIFIPVIVLVVSVYLVFAPIIENPKIEYIYSIVFMLCKYPLPVQKILSMSTSGFQFQVEP